MGLPISASLNNRSIEDRSLDKNQVSADDFYYHFNSKLGEGSLNRMFYRYLTEIMKIIKNICHTTNYEIAIDKTGDPYWGEKDNPYVTGGKRVKSTNYGFNCITASIVIPECEIIIYVRPLTKDDDNDALLVEECLLALRKWKIHITRVLMDREFYNSNIILVCNAFDLKYIIPLKKDSKFKRLLNELIKEGKELPRIFENYEVKDQLTNLIIYEDTNSKGKKEIFGFITNIDVDEIKVDVYQIADFYRRRWAIENANKFQDSFNIPTNCTNGLVRFFFFVLTALLHNFWVLVNLFAYTFSLRKVSLNMFKDICKAIFDISFARDYKHVQRKLWVDILVG